MDYEAAEKKLADFRSVMLNRMIETARHKENYISYSELIRDSGIEVFFDSPSVRMALSAVLRNIVVEMNGQGEDVMLTAVVVRKNDFRPGSGFYDLAAELGKLPPKSSENDKEAFWFSELKKVRQYYQEEKRP